MLLNPKQEAYAHLDAQSQEVMHKTISFFKEKGKVKLLQDFHDHRWYADFVQFVGESGVFPTMLTPAGYGVAESRWDTRRICDFGEILGFFGLGYWYVWQVSALGLGPIWMSDNEIVKQKAAKLLQDGGIFAFGLSEKEHGADIYASDMLVTPMGDGRYRASGRKYYIGNGNEAALVSVFGKLADSGDYIFFVVDSKNPAYTCIKNVVSSQNYVAEFELQDYQLTEADILFKGRDAWDAALNTINICKYNLGWASIGMCTHALYEAVTHASNRRLYHMHVTDFPHVKQLFTDAYVRLVGMKLFALRAADYMRVASAEDRRYLLFNPLVKMKVTTQGEEVINAMWDVIAAKGFEKDMFFTQASIDIRALPKLEGTVHVNIALIIKFMKNYLFAPKSFAEVEPQVAATNDDFLFAQGATKGLAHIQFHDYNLAFDRFDLPNVNLFKQLIKQFKGLLLQAPPSDAQQKDTDFLLAAGEMFALIVYAQLILENAYYHDVDHAVVDQLFNAFIRDFSHFALTLAQKQAATDEQSKLCLAMITKPIANQAVTQQVWETVHQLSGCYELEP